MPCDFEEKVFDKTRVVGHTKRINWNIMKGRTTVLWRDRNITSLLRKSCQDETFPKCPKTLSYLLVISLRIFGLSLTGHSLGVCSQISVNDRKNLMAKPYDITYTYSIYRGYYMAARRYEISLRVLKNISRVSAANEWNIFQHSKRNFVSPSGHVMFYLLYKHQWNAKPFHFNIFFAAKARCIM